MNIEEKGKLQKAFLQQKTADERYQSTRQVVLKAENLPFGLRCALLDWHENILDPGYYFRSGLIQYVQEGHYLRDVWNAARILENLVDSSEKLRRDLSGVERDRISKAFIIASENQGFINMDDVQRDQLKKMAENVPYLISVSRSYRKSIVLE